jgi:hypothetical protein
MGGEEPSTASFFFHPNPKTGKGLFHFFILIQPLEKDAFINREITYQWQVKIFPNVSIIMLITHLKKGIRSQKVEKDEVSTKDEKSAETILKTSKKRS